MEMPGYLMNLLGFQAASVRLCNRCMVAMLDYDAWKRYRYQDVTKNLGNQRRARNNGMALIT